MDESVFGEFANIILEGGTPYVDAVDNKPPLTYCFFSLVYALFGKNNLMAIHFITILIVMATALLIYKSCKEFLNEKTGIIAAIIFTALSHIYEPKYISTNGETLINLPLIISVFLYLKYSDHGDYNIKNIFALIISGIAIGIAIMISYKAGILAIVFIIYGLFFKFLFNDSKSKAGMIIKEFINLCFAGFGAMIVIASILLYFYHLGNLKEFIYWGFTGNFSYIQTGSQTSPVAKTLARFGYFMLCSLPAWAIFAVYIIKKGKNILTESRLLLFSLIWLILSFYAVTLGGRTYGHYFIHLIVPLSIIAGIAYMEIIPKNKKGVIAFWGFFTLLNLVFFISRIDINATYKLINYPNRQADIDYKLIGEYIKKNSMPGKKIYAWGWATSIYYYADRRCGARFLISDYVSGRIFGTANDSRITANLTDKKQWRDFISDLKKNQPVYFIDTSPADHYGYKRFAIEKYPELSDFISNNYKIVKTINMINIYRINADGNNTEF